MTADVPAEEIDRLNTEILQAHKDSRPANDLARLYHRGAHLLMVAGDTDAALFCCSTAYVFALEAGEKDLVRELHATLCEHGREY